MSGFEKGYIEGWRAALDEAVEVMIECFSDMSDFPAESDELKKERFREYMKERN